MSDTEYPLYRCDNCSREIHDRNLQVRLASIPNLAQRLQPGGVVPAGECPECGALCYPVLPAEPGLYIVLHHYRHGTSTYVCRCNRELTEAEAIRCLDMDFEADQGESLEIWPANPPVCIPANPGPEGRGVHPNAKTPVAEEGITPQQSGVHETYHGTRTRNGGMVAVTDETGQTRLLRARLDLRNHSPTGFEWGYGGSGPAQLALALLADACGDEVALRHYQDFKWAVVAGLPASWTLTDLEVQCFVEQRRS